MKTIFPPEIIDNSVENHFHKHSKKSEIIYSSIVITAIITIILLPVIKVDITKQSRGIIRTRLENNQLIPAVYGQIEWLGIEENKDVKAGDTLLIFNSEKIDKQINLYRYKISENENFIADLDALIHNKNKLLTLKYAGIFNEYMQKSKDLKNRILKAHQEYILAGELYKNKAISKTEYDQKKYTYEFALAESEIYTDQQKSSWYELISRYKLENEEYKSNIAQLQKEKDLYFITAPVSGTITQLTGLQKGNFIVPNQLIAHISPHEDLLVECYVSPSDIGYISKYMNAVFQVDAFNYNQWGLGKGYVTDISEDVVNMNEQPYFRVRCKLETKTLMLKNGYTGKLKKGMTLTGRFRVTRRSLFQLLYDKADNWLNPKMHTSERNSI